MPRAHAAISFSPLQPHLTNPGLLAELSSAFSLEHLLKDLLKHLPGEVLSEGVRELKRFPLLSHCWTESWWRWAKDRKEPAFGRMEPNFSLRSTPFLLSAACLVFLTEKARGHVVGGITAKPCYVRGVLWTYVSLWQPFLEVWNISNELQE